MSSRAVLTLASLATASALRHDGALSHVIRTAMVAECLAGLVGLDAAEQQRIRLATPVHDVGKLAIDDAILLKPGRLESHERTAMERHAGHGADILAGSNDTLLQFAAAIARGHHERFDGSGYPHGLAGADIPLAVRVVSVSDAFDAMTEARCYSTGMPEDVACQRLEAACHTHFDPQVVAAFLHGYAQIRQVRRDADRLLRSGTERDVIAHFYALN